MKYIYFVAVAPLLSLYRIVSYDCKSHLEEYLYILKIKKIYNIEASRGAGVQICDCKRDCLWVRSPHEEMQYLIFSILRFVVEAKRSRHLTRISSRIRRKMETECLNTRFPLPTPMRNTT